MADPITSHTLNCGYGHGYSVMQVLDAVIASPILKIVRSIWRDVAPGDPDALISDNREIVARFGWQPKYDDLDTIVSHALQWERALGSPIAGRPKSCTLMSLPPYPAHG
jgi:UDP-glucose 4-epimerase